MNALAKPMVLASTLTTDDWCTPKWLCDLLGEFDLDPCANKRGSVNCEFTYGPDFDTDGIAEPWTGSKGRAWSVFVNPPYSNVTPWAAKLANHDGPWCALLKLDPTTRWWSTLMSANPTVTPFRKRIKFEGDLPMTANFPSVLVFKRWWPSDELEQHLWLATYTRAA